MGGRLRGMQRAALDTVVTVLAGALTGIAAAGDAPVRADLYVAVDGSDAWSGRLPTPNPARTDGPFASLHRARDAVRLLPKTRPIAVLVRGGSYRLHSALVLGPADSGGPDCPITYAAWPGEAPVFSGGRVIDSFRPRGAVWVASLAGEADRSRPFLQLFVNGRRRPRARAPDTGFFRMAGPLPASDADSTAAAANRSGFRFRPGDLASYGGLGEVNIVLVHSWETSIHPVKSVDVQTSEVRFRAPLKEWWTIGHWEREGRYWVENARELLDQPGEWYLDRERQELVYMPMPGETPETTEVVAPVLTDFLRLEGDAEAGLVVDNVHIRGLAFHHADWVLSPTGNSSTQAAVDVPAVVTLDGARNCSIEGCEIAHIGHYGVWVRHGCKDCRIAGNRIADAGAGGIRLGETRMAAADVGESSRTVVHNNRIEHYGEVYAGAVGIWVAHSSSNILSHNHIHDGWYTGISLGWNWNSAPTRTLNNTVEFNHVHHVVRGMLSDGAGVYTLGTQTGTVIRNNLFHDIFPYMGSPAMAWGIYFDAGSNGITVENNVVYNTATGGLMNTGQSGNVVRNNVFAFSAWQAVWRWQRAEEGLPSTVERNVFYLTQGELFHRDGGLADAATRWDRNLYWRTDGEPLAFYDHTLAEWQARGMDQRSVVADPQFEDVEHGDFRLRPGSPAFGLGIQSVDSRQAGLTAESRWYEPPSRTARAELPPVPPGLAPLVLAEGFEDTPVGAQPRQATVITEGQGDQIAVSDERAATGSRSLKVTDVPGLKHPWNPHVFYAPHFRRGKALLSVDVWLGPGADLVHEWRDASRPFAVGPSLRFRPDGSVEANGTVVARAAPGTWLHVQITCGLGSAAQGTYDLVIRAGDEALADRSGLACGSPSFRSLEWLGFVSLATERTEFYLDNLCLDLEKN